MDNIFSDDEDYENVRDQLYCGTSSQNKSTKNEITMFGMYGVLENPTQKLRQDVFLRSLHTPTNDPFDYVYQRKTEMKAKSAFIDNFSFFGMRSEKLVNEESKTSAQQLIAERQRMLERIRLEDQEKNKTIEEIKSQKLKKRKSEGGLEPIVKRRSSKIPSESEDSDSEPSPARLVKPKRKSAVESTRKRRAILESSDSESEDDPEMELPLSAFVSKKFAPKT